MDDLEKINETLSEKEDFYSDLNMGNIADVDHVQARRVFKNFEKKV